LSVPLPGVTLTPATQSGSKVTVPFLAEYITGIYRFAVGIGTILAAIMMVYGGFRYLLAASIPEIKNGKATIINAVVGLVVLLTSYVILRTINPALVNLQPLQMTYVEQVIIEHDNPESGWDRRAADCSVPAPGATYTPHGDGGGFHIPANGSPLTPLNYPQGSSWPFTTFPHTGSFNAIGGLNPALLPALQRASQIFDRLKGTNNWSVHGGGHRTIAQQLATWIKLCGQNENYVCSDPANKCFPPSYASQLPRPEDIAAAVRGISRDSLDDRLPSIPLFAGVLAACNAQGVGANPHTAGVAVDIACTPDSAGSGHFSVPCQLVLEHAMLQAGFCRLRNEPWHFELNSIRVTQNSCIGNENAIVGKFEKNGSAYDYSQCTGTWDKSHPATCATEITGPLTPASARGSAPSTPTTPAPTPLVSPNPVSNCPTTGGNVSGPSTSNNPIFRHQPGQTLPDHNVTTVFFNYMPTQDHQTNDGQPGHWGFGPNESQIILPTRLMSSLHGGGRETVHVYIFLHGWNDSHKTSYGASYSEQIRAALNETPNKNIIVIAPHFMAGQEWCKPTTPTPLNLHPKAPKLCNTICPVGADIENPQTLCPPGELIVRTSPPPSDPNLLASYTRVATDPRIPYSFFKYFDLGNFYTTALAAVRQYVGSNATIQDVAIGGHSAATCGETLHQAVAFVPSPGRKIAIISYDGCAGRGNTTNGHGNTSYDRFTPTDPTVKLFISPDMGGMGRDKAAAPAPAQVHARIPEIWGMTPLTPCPAYTSRGRPTACFKNPSQEWYDFQTNVGHGENVGAMTRIAFDALYP